MKLSLKQWIQFTLSSTALVTSANVFAVDKINFQLDWLPGGDKAPIYVAVQQGFFAEEDLEVTIRQGKGSTDAITKVATGTADIGSSDLVSLLVAKANDDVPVKAIYSVFNKAPYAFYVLDDSGINSVKDVANKSIATSPFTSANVFLPLLLRKNNVDEDSVTVTKADPGALNPMLITGKSDVMISWVTDTVKNQSQAKAVGKELKILPWHDAGLDFYSSSLIASDQFLTEKPDVVKRFVKAYAKAIAYTWAQPEQSAKDVHKMVPEVDPQQASDTIISIKGLVINEVSDNDGIGTFTPERLKETWKWTAEAQQLDPSKFDPETAISRDYLPGGQS
ncbi:ABC transporter substrate-binding protein [Vibrio rumoiensis]|uniref:SsuA/THI5-like domain-containing protein n=1 Tax=Vibrio rumoiensis 1S-45 TaxID=1188252 RepID=A0A1E5E291_9VIBR|nr:ABC transporter substrate-binding protein [Vibrio rumoiensis]OEF25553.1 hypothetical protein A1QC_01335 [Vibrio rumoiensis 1S-45]